MAVKTPMARSRPTEQPYAVFRNDQAGFEWRVLKSYQGDDSKPGARWFLATRSPSTFGSWELGDGYVLDVVRYGRLVDWDREALGEEYGAVLRGLRDTAQELPALRAMGWYR